MSIIIGVDPGLTGAMALLDSQRGVLDIQDIPTEPNGTDSGAMRSWVATRKTMDLLHDWSVKFDMHREWVGVFIERPIPMPTLPAQTIAAQFDTFGVLRSLLGRHAGVNVVNPREWKKLYALGSDKDASRNLAMRLYPDAQHWLKRVKDHNRAESLLIAHWALTTKD